MWACGSCGGSRYGCGTARGCMAPTRVPCASSFFFLILQGSSGADDKVVTTHVHPATLTSMHIEAQAAEEKLMQATEENRTHAAKQGLASMCSHNETQHVCPQNQSTTMRSLPPSSPLAALRAQLAQISINMLPGGQGHGPGWESSASPLVDIGNVCAIFEAAFSLGGARATLQLVNRDEFLTATKLALSEHASGIFVAAAEQGFGITYNKGKGDVFGKPISETRPVLKDSRLTVGATRSWLNGALWWLRHYTGAFLADKILSGGRIPELAEKRDTAEASAELIRWLQAKSTYRRMKSDFALIASLHGAIFHTFAMLSRAKNTTAVEYPVERALQWCPDTVVNKYECRHGIGHGIHLAIWLRRPELANYSACNQLRPYTPAPSSAEEWQSIHQACNQSDLVQAQLDHMQNRTEKDGLTFGYGCRSGTQHSDILFNRRFSAYGISALEA